MSSLTTDNTITIGRHILADDNVGFMYRRKRMSSTLVIIEKQFKLFNIINIKSRYGIETPTKG